MADASIIGRYPARPAVRHALQRMRWALQALVLPAAIMVGMPRSAASSTAAPAVAAPASRDPDRFHALIMPHLDAAHSLARYLSRDADAAQDIVQEAFLRAYRRFGDFRGGNPRAWILAIVRNCHYDWRAERKRTPASTEIAGSDPSLDGEDAPSSGLPADEETPETVLLRLTEAAAVHAVLDMLPEPSREVLVLRELEDCSYREIAEIVAVPIGTVMSRLARARAQFGTIWRRRIQAPEDAA